MSTTTPVRPATPEPATPPPPPPPPRRSLGAMTVGLVLVGVGTVALLATLGIDIPVAVVGPVLLVVLGIGVVVSGIRGESSGGVVGLAIVLGVLLALGSLVGMVLDVPLRGVVGERHHRPASVAELEPNYRVLMGELELDLRDLQLSPGTTTIEASAVLGEVIVRVPPGHRGVRRGRRRRGHRDGVRGGPRRPLRRPRPRDRRIRRCRRPSTAGPWRRAGRGPGDALRSPSPVEVES